MAGITSQYLDALENGRENNPSLKVLAGLCKALEVELAELFMDV